MPPEQAAAVVGVGLAAALGVTAELILALVVQVISAQEAIVVFADVVHVYAGGGAALAVFVKAKGGVVALGPLQAEQIEKMPAGFGFGAEAVVVAEFGGAECGLLW